MTTDKPTIVGLSGSLRKASFNSALLRALQKLELPLSLRVHDYSDVPLYNGDLDGDDKPAGVQRLKDAIAAADGLLIATPEYNYGIPGVLKNALDWASRPAFKSVLVGKPVAVVSTSPGLTGGVRAQAQLKAVLLGVLAAPFPHPETVIPQVSGKLDGDAITDTPTREALERMLTRYAGFLSGQA